MKKSVYTWRRVLALALILVMAVTYMPFLSEPSAYAEAEEEVSEKVVELPDAEQKANKAKAVAEVEDKLGIAEEPEAEEEEPAEMKAVMDVDPDKLESAKGSMVLNSDSKGLKLNAGELLSVSKPSSTGIVRVTGVELNPQYVYTGIWIGNDHPDFDDSATKILDLYGTSFNETVDMKDYAIGYHTIYVTIDDTTTAAETDYVDYVTYVPTYIYKKISNSVNWYQTGKKYVACYYGGDYSSTYYSHSGEYLDVLIDYKKVGAKKWSSKVYGPIGTSSYSLKKKTGLKPNTKYYVRMMLGKKCSYNGKTVWITGRLVSKASKKVKVVTAYSKPRIKKITITNGKKIVHKYRVHYANRIRYVKSTGRIISITPLYRTYRYYYTRYKVNVYFKKKQSIAGIQIKTGGGTVQKNGNKKKYSAKYTVSGKKKGKKIAVKVRCFRSKKYLGFSSWVKKKVKVR